MSTRTHRDALLSEHDGPYFPLSVTDLRHELDLADNVTGAWLGEVAAGIPGFQQLLEGPVTSDGYRWFWGLQFGRGKGMAVVLVPCWNDWDRHDGTQAGRSIAVHTINLDQIAADGIVRELIDAGRERREADRQAAGKEHLEAVVTRPQSVDLRQLLIVTHGNRHLAIAPAFVKNGALKVELLDRALWPQGPGMPQDAGIMVFSTPVSEYLSLEDHAGRLEGRIIDLGELPTLVGDSSSSIEISLERRRYYDVCLIVQADDGSRQVVGMVRYATVRGDIPIMITLDEAKACALLSLGLSLRLAEPFEARVTPMCAWGERGRIGIAGFNLAPGDSLEDPGVMVDHVGRTTFYHGYTLIETQARIGL